MRPRNVGYMDRPYRGLLSPQMPPIVGFAATATFRSWARRRPSGDAYKRPQPTRSQRFAGLSGPPIIVFQDLDDPPVAATFGEVMCIDLPGLRRRRPDHQRRRACRLEQVRAIGFSVFIGGTICSHGYNHIPQVHVPVRVGGLAVYPDDLLHADRNGVTNIPLDIAGEVADIGDEFVAAETIVLEVMRGGAPTPALLAAARAEMAARGPAAVAARQPQRQGQVRSMLQPLQPQDLRGNWATLMLPINVDDSIDYGGLGTSWTTGCRRC